MCKSCTLFTERNQKVAARIKKQVLKTAKSIKESVKKYNDAGFDGRMGDIPDTIEFNEVNKPDCQMFKDVFGAQDVIYVSYKKLLTILISDMYGFIFHIDFTKDSGQ